MVISQLKWAQRAESCRPGKEAYLGASRVESWAGGDPPLFTRRGLRGLLTSGACADWLNLSLSCSLESPSRLLLQGGGCPLAWAVHSSGVLYPRCSYEGALKV